MQAQLRLADVLALFTPPSPPTPVPGGRQLCARGARREPWCVLLLLPHHARRRRCRRSLSRHPSLLPTELYFAIRGGGGTYGIVTDITLQLYDIKRVRLRICDCFCGSTRLCLSISPPALRCPPPPSTKVWGGMALFPWAAARPLAAKWLQMFGELKDSRDVYHTLWFMNLPPQLRVRE